MKLVWLGLVGNGWNGCKLKSVMVGMVGMDVMIEMVVLARVREK